MAPRKGKSDAPAATDGEYEQLRSPKAGKAYAEPDARFVLDYLPLDDPVALIRYALQAIEVSANLHNKVSKGGYYFMGLSPLRTHRLPAAQAAKLLQKLHQEGEVEGRISGKQTVYHALQDASDTATPEAIAILNQDIESFRGQLDNLRANEKQSRAALTALVTKPRLSDLRQDISRLKDERETLQGRVATSASSEPIPITPVERSHLETAWKKWQRHATIRRRICRDLWARCSEVLPEDMTASELWESLGLEGKPQ
ncbi:hypothetical protein NUU61_000370 [Penicillium alfredii]|uniref:Homologous-pairing protein 2 winged helix domain-containing protein n=1 Tax=Penicillium alfredii TaxID=1506179 RepID=A0A9W9G9J0_9EURO|nr:uncharacterized protein NUU61_000370 [Penicillium alfredii]KAJ5114611.1 hypothetical protein NUU61_000370 [Penicillium alfredii]